MHAKDLAKSHLIYFWDKKIPVDVVAIAAKLGAVVIEDPNLELGDPVVSGEFSFENGRPTIKVNPSDAPLRRRFTVAHELGHYALEHGNSFRDPSKHFSIDNFSPFEAAANRYAAEILMPEEAVSELIKAHGVSALRQLAKTFDVSEVAMKYRLKNLGWIT